MKSVFTRIEAKNYRCLKEVSQPLNPFEILVGPNGSGKSTFLDVIRFLSDLASDGTAKAVELRTENFQDLVSGRSGSDFRLGVHVDLPPSGESIRYDVTFRFEPRIGKVLLDAHIVSGENGAGPEARSAFEFAPALPEDLRAAFIGFFRSDIRTVALDRGDLANPSPAGSADERNITGSGLARMVWNLGFHHRRRFEDWLRHVQTALPEVRGIHSYPGEWEKKRFLAVKYDDNVEVPSWMLSEGTLRLLQLTILAYLPDFYGVYLIEEPENGVHPSALETIYQSLSSIYGAQVLVSSHSPILLNMAKPEQLLCFSKSADGIKIVRGSEHPALRDWQHEVSLGTLAASGILG